MLMRVKINLGKCLERILWYLSYALCTVQHHCILTKHLERGINGYGIAAHCRRCRFKMPRITSEEGSTQDYNLTS